MRIVDALRYLFRSRQADREEAFLGYHQRKHDKLKQLNARFRRNFVTTEKEASHEAA